MRNYKSLVVYSKAKEFCIAVYELTNSFPSDEKYNLVSQLKRASVSIGANIVEGCSRESDKEFFRFLEIALGSTRECEFLLELSMDLKIIDESTHKLIYEKLDHVSRLLVNLATNIRIRLHAPR